MKFVLSRTSVFRNIRDIKVDNKKYKVTEGKVYSYCSRKYMDELFIEINSLEELIGFQEDYGELVIRKNIYNGTINEIEIYDDYRE